MPTSRARRNRRKFARLHAMTGHRSWRRSAPGDSGLALWNQHVVDCVYEFVVCEVNRTSLLVRFADEDEDFEVMPAQMPVVTAGDEGLMERLREECRLMWSELFSDASGDGGEEEDSEGSGVETGAGSGVGVISGGEDSGVETGMVDHGDGSGVGVISGDEDSGDEDSGVETGTVDHGDGSGVGVISGDEGSDDEDSRVETGTVDHGGGRMFDVISGDEGSAMHHVSDDSDDSDDKPLLAFEASHRATSNRADAKRRLRLCRVFVDAGESDVSGSEFSSEGL